MSIKYFAGSPGAGREVSPEVARRLPDHTRAYFSSDDALDRAERYDGGRLEKVDYFAGRGLDEVRSFHLQTYPGIPYTVWEVLVEVSGYVWTSVSTFNAAGELTGRSKMLCDAGQRELMTLELDASGDVALITKYYWDDAGELRYVFEYDEEGVFVIGRDLVHHDSASPSEARAHLPEPEFFEDGYRLPRAIAARGIPPMPL